MIIPRVGPRVRGSGRHHPYRGGGGGGDGPPDYPAGGGGGVGGPSYRHGVDGPVGHGHHVPMGGGQRRSSGFSASGRGGSPDNVESSNFAKLFVGSVPRTATEEDIRPLFEEHGNVIEVALIKDRRTGQQQGCCFVKYATLEDADRAIRALHNQFTLPGGHGPIQVRYADGERERLGAVEYKLFVGSLNKQATEKEIEEIFAPYGRVEDVYIMKDDMKQSRGCGFVKFSHRDMASAAIDALNGKYTMRGCDQPLTVRFADPKKGGPAFGGPGYGPRSQPPSGLGIKPTTKRRITYSSSAWHPPSPRSRGPSDGDRSSKIGAPTPSSLPGSLGPLGGPTNGSIPGVVLTSSSMPQQGFSPSIAQVPLMGQQVLPLQKPLMSPKHLQQSLQMHPLPQSSVPYSQGQPLQAPMHQQLGQMQIPLSGGLGSFPQAALPGQQLVGIGGQLPASQPLMQQQQQQPPLGMSTTGQQQLTAPTSLPSCFSNLSSSVQHPVSSGPAAVTTAAVGSSVVGATPSMPVSSAMTAGPPTCNWTEHTSPEGYKYYYNSMTKESKWEKPEELSLFEQQQQQKLQSLQKSAVSQLQTQTQPQLPPQVQSTQQHMAQLQQAQGQMQIRQQAPTQQLQPALYQAPGAVSNQITQDLGYGHAQARGAIDPARIQQGLQAAQEWIWKNKPAGT
ncbi:unnamed protein product [Spirodela intermedia]|uniref:Flowering time control protein FCA n=1 Tax=Spirodela intermedia TaxID=51605 RepID=A0A7I8JS76_SPIIN|nr:unnamed protein product [Spirodela intermedia]CAA6672611.1 unnamed protein product [Spirodela intermedia]